MKIENFVYELPEANALINELRQAIQNVYELHKPSETLGIWDVVCSHCLEGDLNDYVEYPCETLKALGLGMEYFK